MSNFGKDLAALCEHHGMVIMSLEEVHRLRAPVEYTIRIVKPLLAREDSGDRVGGQYSAPERREFLSHRILPRDDTGNPLQIPFVCGGAHRKGE